MVWVFICFHDILSMRNIDYTEKCDSCQLSEDLAEHYRLEGITGLLDDFSEKIYETCEKCIPGIKTVYEGLRDTLLWVRKIERREGHEVAITILQDFLDYCNVSERGMSLVIELYEEIKGVKDLDEFTN